MDKVKHTPGPWNIDETGGDIGVIYITSLNSMESMGTVCDLYFKNEHETHRFSNAKANARLIAAAPELLETLETLVDLYSRSRIPARKKAMNKAEAVIAKAKEL